LTPCDSADVVLRPATEGDEPFLYRVFQTTRERELEMLAPHYREILARHQYNAQRTHYHAYFPDSRHDIILHGSEAIGRLWVDRRPDHILILDIAIVPEARSKGIGTLLLQELIEEAARECKVLRIHVEQFNPALRLYQRLGFQTKETNGVYFLMERPCICPYRKPPSL
jgi:ribosomal protein S18 acetylase RimI-like enzyme